MKVTVRYFNHTAGQPETREHELADMSPASIQAVVDLFDAQVDTVLDIHNEIGVQIYKAMVNEDDLRKQ